MGLLLRIGVSAGGGLTNEDLSPDDVGSGGGGAGNDPARPAAAGGAGGAGSTVPGWTPLHEACEIGSPAAVRLLLESGANPLSRTVKERLTAVHVAARRSDPAALAALFEGIPAGTREKGDVRPVFFFFLIIKLTLHLSRPTQSSHHNHPHPHPHPQLSACWTPRAARRSISPRAPPA
jgi:hypothetical protein